MPVLKYVKSKCSHCDYAYHYMQGDFLGGLDCLPYVVKCPKCKKGMLNIPLSEVLQFSLSPKTNFYRLKGIFSKNNPSEQK